MVEVYSDEYFMQQALLEAKQAYKKGEVPVGAVVVCKGRIIARAHNQTELLHDVTAHAEMLAITSAANFLGGKYLTNCTLYVTLEPCVMCAGALYWSKISKVVFAASDHAKGFQHNGVKLHPKTQIISGILMDEASALLQEFFKDKRK